MSNYEILFAEDTQPSGYRDKVCTVYTLNITAIRVRIAPSKEIKGRHVMKTSTYTPGVELAIKNKSYFINFIIATLRMFINTLQLVYKVNAA